VTLPVDGTVSSVLIGPLNVEVVDLPGDPVLSALVLLHEGLGSARLPRSAKSRDGPPCHHVFAVRPRALGSAADRSHTVVLP
jgi:hypothetical protein